VTRGSARRGISGGTVRNAMSVDVEDWFHPEAVRGCVPEDCGVLEPRAALAVDRLLGVFETAGVHATFFVLGWVAERQPSLVPRIAAAGHEIASHGYSHHMITQQTPAEFASDLRRSLRVLRAQSGQPVVGYRAPSFSVVRDTLWALDVMLDEGLEYDSSIFPVHHDRYGIPDAGRAPYIVRTRAAQQLWELPPVTARIAGHNLPAAGGGYLRLLPYAFNAWALRRINAEGLPGIVYTHPWEYDPQQPRLPLSRARALRHYGRIAGTESKLARLVREFEFGPCRDILDAVRRREVRSTPGVLESVSA
jgi:polysaccharide deacetylase family protein (PEP-CTERM system associated)